MFNFMKKKKTDEPKSNEGIQMLKKALLPKEEATPVYSERVNDMTINVFAKSEEKGKYFWEEVSNDVIPVNEVKQPKSIEEYYQQNRSTDKLPNMKITFKPSKEKTSEFRSIQKHLKVA